MKFLVTEAQLTLLMCTGENRLSNKERYLFLENANKTLINMVPAKNHPISDDEQSHQLLRTDVHCKCNEPNNPLWDHVSTTKEQDPGGLIEHFTNFYMMQAQEHLGSHCSIEFLLNNFRYMNYIKENLQGPIRRTYLDKLLYKLPIKKQIVQELKKYKLFICNPSEI